MPLAQSYVKPGVTVTEVVNPTFSPLLADPTSIAIVAPASGSIALSEVLLLSDNTPVTLQVDGVEVPSLVVTDDNGTVYTLGTDYTYDAVNSQIARAMQTAIDDGQALCLYTELTDSGHSSVTSTITEQITLNLLQTYVPGTVSGAPLTAGQHTNAAHVFLFSQGLITSSSTNGVNDLLTTAGSPPNVRVNSSPTVLATTSKQIVWVEYTNSVGAQAFTTVTLNGTTPVSLPTGSTNWIFKTAPIVVTPTTANAVKYTQAANGGLTDHDYAVAGIDNSLTLARASGTTSMGGGQGGADELQVTVSYTAVPSDYFLPTRVFSVSDCETKYGAALDSSGAISSPASFAASLAFANGATNVVVQALYHLASRDTGTGTTVDTSSVRSNGGVATATNVTTGQSAATIVENDWADTLLSLRDIEDVNVVVPVLSAAGGSTSDAINLNILQKCQAHAQFMAAQNQKYLIFLAGEDSTVTVSGTTLGQAAVLRNHAQALAGAGQAEAMTLLSPASFQYANPVSSSTSNIGGQYVAAACAGMLAARSIQTTLTRKQVLAITGVNDFRSESDKDTDAKNGLMVVENKGGVIRVRHAITVAVSNNNTRELSVIRAKYNMIDTVRDTIESQIIGQIIADDRAPFTVQLLVGDTLEALVDQGIIASYDDIQVQQLASEPTALEVRYSYLPAFPLNYVNVVFSINTASGAVVASTSQGV